jgi:hypothetical protein
MSAIEEIMQLVRILDDEGFGVLAGELLAEVNTSRATDADPTTGEVDDIFTEFDAASASRAIQLEDAIRFLRLRLIEPARHLAEAERIAGVMQQGEPIKILFVDEEGDERIGTPQHETPGRQEIADKLDALFERIRNSPSAPSV